MVPRVFFESIDSTNEEARRRVAAGETGPIWLASGLQTAGRGRRGRAWETASGNLAASFLFPTDKPLGEAAQVSFVAALAAHDLACAYLPKEKIALKWPNDLLIERHKAAGILVESGSLGSPAHWLVVGMGFNLAHAPEQALNPATSFADHGANPSPEAALEVLAKCFARRFAVWQLEGFAPIAKAWTERAAGLGETCTARLPNETVTGISEGLAPDGGLRLRLNDGSVRVITAGDVFFGAP